MDLYKYQLLTIKTKDMKTNTIKITFWIGNHKYIQATTAKIKKAGNVIKYVMLRYSQYNVHMIETRREGYNDPDYKYWELHYDSNFENWKNDKVRVEATNESGYEDYTGYGNYTDGKKNRFYLGRSTGWLPVYLEILKSNSMGGGSLFLKNRTFKPLYN